MMKGYYNNERATNEIIKVGLDGKRWIETGDLGYIDKSGRVYVIGRKKRMIVRSGNKLFPSNIENLLVSMQEISQCSIVGMPDEKEKTEIKDACDAERVWFLSKKSPVLYRGF